MTYVVESGICGRRSHVEQTEPQASRRPTNGLFVLRTHKQGNACTTTASDRRFIVDDDLKGTCSDRNCRNAIFEATMQGGCS